MALPPDDARIRPQTLQDYVDWLEIQIDGWLTSEWNEPSTTCFHVPSYLKGRRDYWDLLQMVQARYLPTWPYLHVISPDAYTCDMLVFVTKECEAHSS